MASLGAEVTEAEERLERLYRTVEDGLTDLDEVLKERIAALKLDRERAKAALERIKPPVSMISIDPETVERFGRMMRDNITAGDVPFRKAYINSVVDRIEVDDHAIRIIGDKASLEQIIAGSAKGAVVRSHVRKWRARRDSNSRPSDSKSDALSS
jgi:site-specific DNA recombinase